MRGAGISTTPHLPCLLLLLRIDIPHQFCLMLRACWALMLQKDLSLHHAPSWSPSLPHRTSRHSPRGRRKKWCLLQYCPFPDGS